VVAREIFEEGFAIPAMHMIREGEANATFFSTSSRSGKNS
jgi:N-methylhydantoinase B/oxoprolinase/acetone carboxylase alpha subunit